MHINISPGNIEEKTKIKCSYNHGWIKDRIRGHIMHTLSDNEK